MSDYSYLSSDGGQKIAAVAAGAGAADVVVSAKPGRVCRLVVTTAGTAALELYDHASASAGATLIWKSIATPAVGDSLTLDIPVQNGIVAKQASGSAAITVSFVEDATGGRGVYDKASLSNKGGNKTSFHAAGAGGAAAASAAPCRLCRLVVLAAGTAATLIYDNASAASGTLLYSLKASPTVGDIVDLQIPASAGIYVAGAANTSSVLVTYATSNAFGR